MLVLTVFGLIPVDIVARLNFLKSLTRESPKTSTLTKQVTISPSALKTTYHNITITSIRDKYVIKIDALSLSTLYDLININKSRIYSLSTTNNEDTISDVNCLTQECNLESLESSEEAVIALDVKVLYENETYVHLQVEYIRNEVTRTALIEQATLWNYTEVQNEVVKTGTLTYINILEGVEGGILERYKYYILTYSVRHVNYELFIGTSLISLGEKTYSSTFIQYVSSETSEPASPEFVEAYSLGLVYIYSPVTLSQYYSILATVAGELINVYVTSGFIKLVEKYQVLETTLSELAELVESELAEYDVIIQESSAIIVTQSTWSEETIYVTLQGILRCLMLIARCIFYLITIPEIIEACTICLQIYFCLPACFIIFMKLTCLLCILIRTVDCLRCACRIYRLVGSCYEAGRCLGLW
jgi:hypothetical protein